MKTMSDAVAEAPRQRSRGRARLLALATVAPLAAGALVGLAAPANAAPLPTAAQATTAVPTGATTLVNVGSGKCIDTVDGGRANGTEIQQWQCWDGSANQRFQLSDAGGGFITIAVDNARGQVIDLEHAVANAGTKAHLWSSYGGPSQQWRPAETSAGVYELHSRLDDGKCLTVTGSTGADGARLQTQNCTGSGAQRFRIGATPTQPGQTVSNPFGPNVKVIDPSWSTSKIKSTVDEIYGAQRDGNTAQFAERRDAVIFTPGTYSATVNVGFNTQILGAGKLPGDVTINGHVRADSTWMSPNPPADNKGSQYNGTQNFWRGVENLTVNPAGGQEMWAVSQAAPMRRVQINGDLLLATPRDNGEPGCGYTSGGLLADSRITGTVDSCSQQQWLTRNSQIGGWTGSNWNIMFQGVQGAPGEGNDGDYFAYTVEDRTPVVREKPFVYIEGGQWKVFVPALRNNTSGTSWSNGNPAGESKPLSDFYVTKAGDTAATINAQLAAGKNLIVTPGIYKLSSALKIDRANTVVLGLGLATLQATNGNAAIEVGDVDGVKLAGLLVDAGAKNSDTLVKIGAQKTGTSHSANPTSVNDLYVRIGGPAPASVTKAVEVNSNDVIGDHLWIWLADHGLYQTDWNNTTGRNGLVVNGDGVTMSGLFVEHFQQYQTLWNGQNGRTFFYQNETPYFVPDQGAWKNGSQNGWAAYKVADNVTNHQAVGLGSYAVFFKPGFQPIGWTPRLSQAFEAPRRSSVTFRHMVTVAITGGSIDNVINGTGGATPSGVKAVRKGWYAG